MDSSKRYDRSASHDNPVPCTQHCTTTHVPRSLSQPPNCGVTSITLNMRPLKGMLMVLPVGFRKVSGG